MTDILLVLAGKQLCEHVVGSEHPNGKRRHESLRARRHHRADGGTALPQAADQIEALIGRDTAGNDEKDAFSLKRHDEFRFRRAGVPCPFGWTLSDRPVRGNQTMPQEKITGCPCSPKAPQSSQSATSRHTVCE